MPKTKPFEKFYDDYDEWFERNNFVYLSELEAIKSLLPKDFYDFRSVEIGVGTGRFALPLGIKLGVEPSPKMREIAKSRGIDVIDAYAENLPFRNEIFDLVLMVTTICFLDDVNKALREVYRVLKQFGIFVVGFIDRNSPIGRIYQERRESHRFYSVATFYSTDELLKLLSGAGFRDFDIVQTIFKPLNDISSIEPVKKGYGEGSFVVIKAVKYKDNF